MGFGDMGSIVSRHSRRSISALCYSVFCALEKPYVRANFCPGFLIKQIIAFQAAARQPLFVAARSGEDYENP